jgi:hypothetical protein
LDRGRRRRERGARRQWRQRAFRWRRDVRSFARVEDLSAPGDVLFELTQATKPPSQPWRGNVSAIRFDPVARFLESNGNPGDGWVDVEEIRLR